MPIRLDARSPDFAAAFRAFLDKAAELLEHKIHLLIADVFPPGRLDPHGIHAAIWQEIADKDFTPPEDKPLTLVAYESALSVKAHIEPIAVGDPLPDMPLFLEPGGHVSVPLAAERLAGFPASAAVITATGSVDLSARARRSRCAAVRTCSGFCSRPVAATMKFAGSVSDTWKLPYSR